MALVEKLMRYESILFTGSNSTEIRDKLNDYSPPPPGNPVDPWAVTSVIGGVALIENSNTSAQVLVDTGQHVVFCCATDSSYEVITETRLNERFLDYEDVVSAALPPPVLAVGVATVPSLLGNTQTTVQVTITPTMPDTSYTAVAVITGGVALLASLSVLSTTKVSGSRVDVVVRNTGLLTLAGASVLVVAVDQ